MKTSEDARSQPANSIELDSRYCLGVYRRQPITLVRGSGCRVWDDTGREYLDWVAGIAVDVLGHCHPKWVEAIQSQVEELGHISNLYYNRYQPLLAQRLSEVSGLDRVFFTNSGAESVEATLKIARKWAKVYKDACFGVVSFEGSFHGRTMGAVSATGQKKYQQPFEPLVPGFAQVPLMDQEALDQALNDSVCALILEPIQGEGGLRPIPPERLRMIRQMCDERRILMIVDEIQTGIGRTGKWFAYQHAGILPDLVAVAKGLGSGFPIGACLARGDAAEVLSAGEHGSTFAGSPLATRTGLAVLDAMRDEQVVQNAEQVGRYFAECLREDLPGSVVQEVRGMGLMLGVQLTSPIARDVVEQCRINGLLINAVKEDTLRIVPPLILTKKEVDEGMAILRATLDS